MSLQIATIPVATSLSFTLEECAALARVVHDRIAQPGQVGGVSSVDDGARVVVEVRRCRSWLLDGDASFFWACDRLRKAVSLLNSSVWGFDLESADLSASILEYPAGGHYSWHVDLGAGEYARRKLSLTLQLSSPSEYLGGDLELYGAGSHPTVASRDLGALTLFPSYILHRVTPVTNGKRVALVAWAGGPPFR
jgi:PKHD-type hydroxylase